MPDSPTSNHTTSESHESAIDWLRRIADSYVNELFDQYQPNPPRESRDGKVIRDPIHGFIHLSDLETAVLDSPLVQRLRYIHQNGFAYLVYPSARLRQSIAEKASRYVAEDLSIEDVWIDLPEDLKSGGLTRCHVRLHDGVVKPLYDLFPMANLLDTYGEHKWTGHVFCAPRKGVPRAVNRAAREVFQDEFKIEFEDHGTTNCKLQI